LMYYPSSVEGRIKIQINAVDDGIYYELFTKKEYIYQIKSDKLQFPYTKEYNLNENYTFDHSSGQGATTIDMKRNRDDEFLILLTIKPKILDHGSVQDVENTKVFVNINSQAINILSPNVVSEENIKTDLSEHRYYKFFARGHKDLDLVLIPCMCMTDMFLFKTYEDALNNRNSIQRTLHMTNGEKKISLKNVSGPFFVKVMLNSESDHSDLRSRVDYCAYQIVLLDKAHENYKYSIDQYAPENNGQVDYRWAIPGYLVLNWGKVVKQTPYENIVQDTIHSEVWAVKVRIKFF